MVSFTNTYRLLQHHKIELNSRSFKAIIFRLFRSHMKHHTVEHRDHSLEGAPNKQNTGESNKA